MAEHLSDEEQLEALKRWWNANGLQLVAILLLAVGGWYGWQFWQGKQLQLAEESSIIYNAMLEQAARWEADPSPETAAVVSAHAETLKGLKGDSRYAYYAALMVAKLAVADGDYEAATAELKGVMASADDVSLRGLARLRLARVESARGNDEEALKLLDAEDVAEFTALYAELKGDIHARQGDREAARAAYQTALDNLGAQDARARSLLELKMNEVMPDSAAGVVEENA